MIHHQGHIFNIGSNVDEMRCVRVRFDPNNVHPIGSKVLVNSDMLNLIKGGEIIIPNDRFAGIWP